VPTWPQRPLPFRVYAITDRRAVPEGMLLTEAVSRLLVAAPAGRVAVQLRDKDLPAEERASLAADLRVITRRHGALLFINGDLELARSCGADGVHFADGDPGLEAAAAEPGQRLWLGASCHDAQSLRLARSRGAHFTTLSPVLPSPGKAEPGAELGWQDFAEMVDGCSIPTFALGGLGPAHAEQACAAGAWGVAAIRSLLAADDPVRTVQSLLEPFAPVGSGARGGRIGRLLSCALALCLSLSLGGCVSGQAPSNDDDSGATDDDDSSDEPPPTAVDIPLPDGPFALDCSESEPDDIDIPLDTLIIPEPPWAEATDCGILPATAGALLLHVRGTIQDLVDGTWNGDNDSYQFTTDLAVTPTAVLRWDPLQGDFDARVLCQRAGGWDDVFGHGLATAALAESATAEFEIEAGSTCWIVIIGYSGLVGSYDLWLEIPAER